MKEEIGGSGLREKMTEIQVDYKRDMHNSYLVIRTEEMSGSTYRISMLLNNRIEGLLGIELRTVDEKNAYYYDISSKQSFACIYERKTLRSPELRKLVRDIISIVGRGKEYLLDENDFVLRPEYIYLSLPACEVSLCYIPGYQKDMQRQLAELFEVLMNQVDYKDEEAVLMIYSLYMAGREENCTFDKLLQVLKERSGGNGENETGRAEAEEISGRYTKKQPEDTAETERGFPKAPEISEKKRREEAETDRRSVSGKQSASRGERNPMFLSAERRRRYILSGAAGVCAALSAAGYAGFGIYENGPDPISLCKAAVVILIASAVSFRAFHSLIRRRGPKIRPLYLDTEEPEGERSIRRNEFDRADVFGAEPIQGRKPEEESENGLSANPSEPSEASGLLTSEDEDRTVMLAELAAEEYCLVPMGRHTDERTILDEFPYYIGKWREHVNLVLQDNTVSRFHAKITKEEDGLYLTDLNSTNGTFLNQEKLAPNEKRRLSPGDELAFAAKRYQFKVL